MPDEVIEFLVKNRFGVMASIDGPAAAHDRHRVYPDGKGSYESVAANVKKLLAAQLENGVLPVKLRATMTKENYKDYDDLRQFFLDEFPGARIMIGETTGTVEYVNEWDVPHDDPEFQRHWFDEFRHEVLSAPLPEIVSRYHDHLRAMRDLHVKLNSPKANTDLPQICGVCRNMLAVSSDGKYYPCHRFMGMDKYVLGDTKLGLTQDAMLQFYTKLVDSYQENCSTCWARSLCGGDCPAYLAGENGSILKPSVERCEALRKGYEMSISVYYSIREHRPDIYRKYIAR